LLTPLPDTIQKCKRRAKKKISGWKYAVTR